MQSGDKNFLSRPLKNVVRENNIIGNGGTVTFNVTYVGCIEIYASMKALDFSTRSLIARECIHRVRDAKNIKKTNKRIVEKRIQQYISALPCMEHAGSNVSLNISSRCLEIKSTETSEVIARHDMPRISFASGGDTETLNYIAYVAKDVTDWRACYVLECGNKAQPLISTLGEAFEFRYKEYKSEPEKKKISLEHFRKKEIKVDDQEYYNDLPGKVPPDVTLTSPAPIDKRRERLSSNLIDLDSPIEHEYVNESKIKDNDGDKLIAELMKCSNKESKLLMENWFHGSISRTHAESLLKHDGDFLVRESQNTRGQFVLTGMKSGYAKHLLLIDPEGCMNLKGSINLMKLIDVRSKRTKHSNVLFLLADDAGFESGTYLNKIVQTPNIDAFAKRSVIFNKNFVSVSSCSPSRAAILTGSPSHQNGMYGLHQAENHFNSFDNIESLPSLLRKNNIRTGLIGKKHVGPSEVFKFDYEETEEKHSINQVGRNITKIKLLVREFLNTTKNDPFFLMVAFHDPHRCGHVTPQYGPFCERWGSGEIGMGLIPDWHPIYYQWEQIQLPYYVQDTEPARRDIAAQYMTISRLDQGIGLVIRELQLAGKLNDTLIVYTSDNGPPFPSGRTNFYDPGMAVPLLISSPFHKQRWHQVSNVMTSQLDLVPTFLDWYGVSQSHNTNNLMSLTGKSLIPILDKEPSDTDFPVFGSHNFHEVTMSYPMRVVRTKRYKLIHNLNYQSMFPIDQDFYVSPTFQDLINRTISKMSIPWYKNLKSYYKRDEWELFDLKLDGSESINIANKKDYADILKDLQQKLWKWQVETNDPWRCAPHAVLEDKGEYKEMSGLKLFSQNVSITHKVILISVTTGVAILGVLATYMSRRKSRGPIRHQRTRAISGRRTRNSMRSPNDALSIAGSRTSARSVSPGGSIHTITDIVSYASGSTKAPSAIANGTAYLSPQQLGVMGMEKLDTVINFWEDALAAHSLGSAQPEDAEFFREIQNLLDIAYQLQEQSELLFLDERSCLFRQDHDDPQDPNFDSAESFASALDQIADLREFEDFEPEETEHLEHPLYQSILKQMDEHPIPCRILRTELVRVASDTEYLAKLHCVRLAFHHLFRDPMTSKWVSDTGRQILTDLMCLGDKDPKDFIVGYETMLEYLQDPVNWQRAEMELNLRGVKAMTFYDIVLDFIILDAFKDLDSPPGSVMAVIQNRFLSNGFKETALTTAVWSVLKAKKRMLTISNGFMAYFYLISEQISPLMAWGFFGSDENLKEVCYYFRNQVLEFLIDIFNFQKVRYTTVDVLSQDILKLMKERVSNINIKFMN
ncbi:CLUMA_CG018206, isoform A [Clunio marinus]|uniref:CLUMA_CG018206, isoform A n=1 Tax=Clunio marinus TaxID=568069 RepID=A0A1J1J0M6_9DIPT|nr:CLUMA_CG018206, isoform A [Clunio marinus]